MIKTVLFDMDGVISDTEKTHYTAYKKALHDVGYEINHEIYVEKLQARSREVGICNIISNATEEDIKEVSRLKDIYYKEELEKGIHLYQDTFRLIELLDETKIKMAVVSASKYAEYQIAKMNLDKYFEFIISGTDKLDIRNKPYPDIYLHAFEKLNINPLEAIVIEDSYNGVKAALGSGAKVIGINRGYLKYPQSDNLLIIDSLDEVIKFFY